MNKPEQFFFPGMEPAPASAGVRLTGQMKLVFDYMADHEWHTLAALAAHTGIAQATASAALRSLRKQQFGGHTVEKQRREATGIDAGGAAVWEYRLR